jgi:hypothetical protein
MKVKQPCSRTLGCIPLKIVRYLILDGLVLPCFWGEIYEKTAILKLNKVLVSMATPNPAKHAGLQSPETVL